MGRWLIEPIAEADCDELAAVHVEVWREAYDGLVPSAYLASLDPHEGAARWRRRIAADDGVLSRLARDSGGRIVGFGTAGPPRDEPPVAERELWALYLLARARGTGAADELLAAVLGPVPASLWVLEGNARGRAFYRRHGFAEDGAREVHPATGAAELRMVRGARRG